MKITEINGDIFESLVENDVIAHGANCQGVMGAGVAKPIKERYPENFKAYRYACLSGRFRPGDALAYVENGQLIFNLATQYDLGPDAKLINIEKSVKDMLRRIEIQPESGIKKVKTVRLGCGIGGLNWDDVRAVLEDIDSSIELMVYYI